MNDEQILLLAQQSLDTPQGQSLLGDPIDEASITTRIEELSSQYNVDTTNLQNTTSEEATNAFNQVMDPTGLNLTRDQRRENRTLSNADKIQQLRETFGGTTGAATAEIKSLKSKLNSYIPKFQVFTIKGRIFDKTTGEVLKGVKVVPGINPQPLGQVEKEVTLGEVNGQPLITQNIEVDPNNFTYVPVPTLIASNSEIRTDDQGNFEIKVKCPIIPANQRCLVNIALLFSKSGFIPENKPLLNGDRTIKSDLQASSLTNIQEAAKVVAKTYDDTIDQAQNLVNQIALSGVEKIISGKKKSINKLQRIVKQKLLPLCTGLLIAFGISKLSQKNQKTCPSPTALEGVIRRRNLVVRQLNQIYRSIAINTTLAVAFNVLSKVFEKSRLSIDKLPFPQAVGGPGPVGLVFAQPYSTTAQLQKIDDLLEEYESQQKELNKAMLTALLFLIGGVTICLLLLKEIDKMSQDCAEGEIDLETIDNELLALTQESEEEGNPVINELNGFKLSVETDNINVVGSLRRRFAVGKNAEGLTLLKGEPSFSSNDQILIDELVFYIQQNDLKAY